MKNVDIKSHAETKYTLNIRSWSWFACSLLLSPTKIQQPDPKTTAEKMAFRLHGLCRKKIHMHTFFKEKRASKLQI